MNSEILQYIGYVASGIIAISMMMSSIVKFRWINLIGATTFATYGFLLGAIPVGLLNTFIVAVDVFFLFRIYSKKELFQTLEIRANNNYLLAILDFYKKDIETFFPGFNYKPELNTVSFLILRNMKVAGVFLAHKEDDGKLKVGLDFVTPEYRDYKTGKYIYLNLVSYFKGLGFNTLIAKSNSDYHKKYLKKMGFISTSKDNFEKVLK